MANKIIFNFAEKTLGTGDEVRLTITFNTSILGADIIFNAEENEIYISDYGEGVWEHDIEEFLLSPGEWSPKLSDANGVLANYFVGRNFEHLAAEKNALVLFEIKYLGETNWVTEFRGKVDPLTVVYDEDTSYLTFTAAPQTNILFNTLLHDPGNPSTHYNPLGYGINDIIHITQILEDIYQLVNPSISFSGGSLVVSQDWLFKGFTSDPPDYDPIIPIEDIPFTGVRHAVKALFFDESYGYQSVGDLLKKFAADFGCYTGMEHEDKAFFKKIFSYTESDVYDLDNESYYKYEQRIIFNKIEYVVYTLRFPYTPSTFDFPAGVLTANEDKILRRNCTTWIAMSSVIPEPGSYLVYHHNGVKDYAMTHVKDLQVGSTYQYLGFVLAQMWLNIRGQMKNCMADEIETPGLRHSITKNPRFKGKVYHVTRLVKHYYDGYTSIEGIPISG